MEPSITETEKGASETEPSSSPPGQASFPHEPQTEHWDVDFSDSKEVYEGMALPVWILAGWAAFIIWAIVYLMAGARTAF